MKQNKSSTIGLSCVGLHHVKHIVQWVNMTNQQILNRFNSKTAS